MPRRTRVSLRHRQALNRALIQSARLPIHEPRLYLRALRSLMRMSQRQLGRRSGVPRAHITRIESGKVDPQLSTLRKLFEALFCDLVILPRARRRPTEALAEREIERPYWQKPWDDYADYLATRGRA